MFKNAVSHVKNFSYGCKLVTYWFKITNIIFSIYNKEHQLRGDTRRLHQNRRKFCRHGHRNGILRTPQPHGLPAQNHRLVAMTTDGQVKLLHLNIVEVPFLRTKCTFWQTNGIYRKCPVLWITMSFHWRISTKLFFVKTPASTRFISTTNKMQRFYYCITAI